jgi:hypothetical protein
MLSRDAEYRDYYGVFGRPNTTQRQSINRTGRHCDLDAGLSVLCTWAPAGSVVFIEDICASLKEAGSNPEYEMRGTPLTKKARI